MGAPDGSQALVRCFTSPTPEVRQRASTALEWMGRPALPAIAEALPKPSNPLGSRVREGGRSRLEDTICKQVSVKRNLR